MHAYQTLLRALIYNIGKEKKKRENPHCYITYSLLGNDLLNKISKLHGTQMAISAKEKNVKVAKGKKSKVVKALGYGLACDNFKWAAQEKPC